MMGTGRRVVVTGLGLATSLGLGIEENWKKVLSGTPGIRRVTRPHTLSSPVQAVGEVVERDWNTIKNEFHEEAQQEGERRTLFALWAAQSALNDAGIAEGTGEKYGIVLAAGLGINRLEDIQGWLKHDGSFDIKRFGNECKEVHRESIMRNNSHRPSTLIARKFGFHGINCTITTACASATQALGTGYRSIQRGDTDLVVAGGADSMINPIGLVFMGEGAGIAVLEERSHAIKRGATIYAELAGYGSSMDAYQVTAPHPRGGGAELSMRSALTDAHLKPENIDYINAHGTSTKLNDTAETLAIKRVFGDHAYKLSVSSSKSMIGHLLAASGGPEFVYTTLSVYRDEVHPTINLTNPDPKCDLDYVPNVKRSRTVGAALSNSFGFGGQNASIIVKKYAE
jgi:3-oxoacyl-[acyl-carrier-protein] synthase II